MSFFVDVLLGTLDIGITTIRRATGMVKWRPCKVAGTPISQLPLEISLKRVLGEHADAAINRHQIFKAFCDVVAALWDQLIRQVPTVIAHIACHVKRDAGLIYVQVRNEKNLNVVNFPICIIHD